MPAGWGDVCLVVCDGRLQVDGWVGCRWGLGVEGAGWTGASWDGEWEWLLALLWMGGEKGGSGVLS